MAGEPRTRSVENAAEAYLEVFDDHGVDYFFNSPGSEDSPFWECFAKWSETDPDADRMEHVNCRHESVAVNMAKGYALMTGDPQVVKLHVNVGPLHAAMDIYGADHAGLPMVVLGSYNSTHEGELPGGTSGPHYLNYQQPGGHENNFTRYTKWLADLKTNENCERVFDRAFRVSSSSPAGPVVLNLQEELLDDETKRTVNLVRNQPAVEPSVDASGLATVADALETAANPLIIAGSIGRDEATVDALVDLAETLKAPVFENQKNQFNFPMDHRLYIGASSGTAATPDQYFGADFDLVLVLGSSKPWYPPEGSAPDAEIIALHPEPVQEKKAAWNYPADTLLPVDPATVLPALAESVSTFDGQRPVDWERVHEEWAGQWRRKARAGRDATPIDPFWLCDRLDAALPDDAIVCDETILHASVIANVIREGTDRRYFNASRLNGGGLGSGLALAAGAKLAERDRLTAVLIGDGSYNYNPVTASFGTAQELGLPLLTVVFNNGGYRSMKATLRSKYPDGWAEQTDTFVGSPISPEPTYEKEMAVWDGYGETVTEPAEIEPALERAIHAVESRRLAMLDVRVEESPPDCPTTPL